MKLLLEKMKMLSPIISWISLAGCIALSYTTITTIHKLKETEKTISNYASQPTFTIEMDRRKRTLSLLDILNQHSQQINELYNRQSNMQWDIDRSNDFLDDYNTSRALNDGFFMDHSY